MNKTVCRWQLTGFLFTSALGTFLHFLYDITGESAVSALFSAVNESIWEHMKLLFYPMLLFAFIEYRAWGNDTPRFWCVKMRGILLGLGLIPVIYYTYTGLLGVSADWFNITIFFLAAAAAYFTETKRFMKDRPCLVGEKTAQAVLVLIALLFTVFTFFPPRIPFFQDPQTGMFGR